MHSSDRRLPIPKLPIKKDVPAVTSMSVTAFADYLRCPYRFYLRHVLKFKPLDDEANELAANQFGNLVHAALEEFGLSDDRDEGNADKIEAILANHLNQFASKYYGKSVSTAVQLQIAQAQRRFKAVARQQAQRIAEGWRIHATEASVSERDGAFIEVDNRKMGLRGRFDRIDHHPGTGRWAILDYKTHGFRPEKKHLKKTDDGHRWIDLQLPLYRLMIPYLGIDAVPDQVQLGYFNVSEKEEDTRINIAGFTPDQMRQAEQVIRDCVSGIWAGNFQPASDRIQYDDYGMILQTSVANRLLDQVEWLSGPELES
jgi:ATP-dependent helicase/DNAse subunit B